jgi:hypothetical protein
MIKETIKNALNKRSYKADCLAHFNFFSYSNPPHITEGLINSKNISLEHLVEIEEEVNKEIVKYIEGLEPPN